ncbi:GntR family transcriptional regulator [Alcaligenaceae bacterium B3P038]|nr:GntR family transcriptional regulator [Alcaligenaceae bacterium B3P038]
MQNAIKSGRTRAYHYIRDQVLPDPAAQGTFITEEEVAERVGGISRTPVREAFLLLGAEGLLQLVPRHGAFISPVTRQDIEEVLELRAVIEAQAVHRVIAQGTTPLNAMKEALAHQTRVAGIGSEREFNEWDTEFHLSLVRATGNSLMTKIYADLRTRMIRIGVLSLLATRDRQQQVIAEHQRIVDALASGDTEAAMAAVNIHIDRTGAGLKEI